MQARASATLGWATQDGPPDEGAAERGTWTRRRARPVTRTDRDEALRRRPRRRATCRATCRGSGPAAARRGKSVC